MKLWKVVGLAGIAGVAATGVAVARAERRRRAFEPDDVRARLHERHRQALEADRAPASSGPSASEPPPGCSARLRAPLSRWRRRR